MKELLWRAVIWRPPVVVFAAVSLLWMLVAKPGFAQAPVSLSDVISEALRNSPAVVSLDRELALRLADAIDVEARANPEIEVMGTYSDKGDGVGFEVEVSQPLRFSDFNLRPLYAEALRQTATVEQEAGVFDLVNRVTSLYLAHWAAQSREALARRATEEAAEITARIEDVRRAQTVPTVQFNVFVPEALRQREDATRHAAERAHAEALLAVEIGGDGGPLVTSSVIPTPLPSLDRVLDFAETKDFGARLARARITVNEARLKVAERDRQPVIVPRASYEFEPGGEARNWGVGVAFEIPLWDVNGGEVARAQAALEEARLHLTRLNAGARDALVAGLYRQVSLLDRRANAYRTEIVPAYRQTYQDMRVIYDQGQADVLGLWQVKASLLEAEEEAITTAIDALSARVALERAIGGKIEQVN